MLTQRGLENNEMFLLKKSNTCKSKHIYINVPLVEVSTQVHYKIDYKSMTLYVPLLSSEIMVIPPRLID
jgi:hypothetical protein